MTDKKEPTVIHGAKLYFETIGGSLSPPRHLGYRARADVEAYTVHTSITIMRMQVFFIAGYDPQKLLPAPPFEREFMQSMSEWAAERIKLPYTEFANSVLRDSVIGDGFIDFKTHSDHPMSSAAYFFADKMTRIIKAMTPREAPVLVIGTDFGAVEAKALSYIHATLVHESAGGSPTPRGKTTIYDEIDEFRDYIKDQTGITDAMLGRDIVDDLFSGQFARQISKTASKPPPREHAAPHRDQSYLAHDPTKRHKRRKKR